MHVSNGTSSLIHSQIANCSATFGGGLYAAGGHTLLGNETLIRNCSATEGSSFLHDDRAAVVYALPAPPGRWVPGSVLCEVDRKDCDEENLGLCPFDADSLDQCVAASLGIPEILRYAHCNPFYDPESKLCKLNLCSGKKKACRQTLDPPTSWYCPEPNEEQKCIHKSVYVPSLLNKSFHIPTRRVDTDFPHPCSAGFLGSAEPNSQSSGHCAGPCTAGKYCKEATSQELPCTRGHYCGKMSPLPQQCPAGTYSNATNLTGASECTNASQGYFAIAGSTQQTPCPKGSYTNEPKKGECTPCSSGTYQDEEGKTACKPCKAGSYCQKGAAAALPCDGGTYSSATDNDEQGDCVPAAPGSFAVTGSTQQTPCPKGSYTNASMPVKGSCTLCVGGSYQDETGAGDVRPSGAQRPSWQLAPSFPPPHPP